MERRPPTSERVTAPLLSLPWIRYFIAFHPLDALKEQEEKLARKLETVKKIINRREFVDVDYSIFQGMKGDADTLAGLVLEVNGEIPVKNDKLIIKGFELTITAADDRRIKKIKVKTLPHSIETKQ